MSAIKKNTPIEKYQGIYVKREDLCCSAPGPALSKMRGVYPHIEAREEKTIAVLDTYRSLGGWCTAYACSLLGKKCVNYYPKYKEDRGEGKSQRKARKLGALIEPMKAGRSIIMHHQIRKEVERMGWYLLPNAMKLPETVYATSREARDTDTKEFDAVVLPTATGTIAAGVIRGLWLKERWGKSEFPKIILYLGYSRPRKTLLDYISSYMTHPLPLDKIQIIDTNQSYRKNPENKQSEIPFPSSPYYEQGAWEWTLKHKKELGKILFWNAGV